MANKKNSERNLIFEEVRKAQSRLNRIAGTAVLNSRDNALLGALTNWMHVELLEQVKLNPENLEN